MRLVVFNFSYDTIFDVDDFVGLIGHSTFMSHYDDGDVAIPQKITTVEVE